MSSRIFIMAGAAFCLVSQACLAQEGISTEKDAIALETARQALDAARQKQLLDALGSIKQSTEGKAVVTDVAATAEGLLVADVGMRSAALTMVDKVVTWKASHSEADKPLILVLANQAPSVAQWQAFDRASRELKDRLALVAKDWKTVTTAAAPGAGGQQMGMMIAPLAGIALVTTLSSLIKTDYGIAGTRLAPSAEATRAVIIWALRARSVAVQLPEYTIATEPVGVKALLDDLLAPQKVAAGLYHDDYLKRLSSAGGKPDKLDPVIATAGANLATALADYDALIKGLYTPTSAVLPIVEIERQRVIAAAAATQPVLYVSGFSSALTAVTKKGLFTGIRSTPANLRVAATIDFVLAVGTSAEPSRVSYSSPVVAFDKAVEYHGTLPSD